MSLVHIPDEVYEGTDAWDDEPNFPRPEHRRLYRSLVQNMEREATVLPGMQTVVGILFRNLARDYVVRVIADQAGGAPARSFENSRRMQGTVKLLLDQAARGDLEHADRMQFVLGLATVQMKVLNSLVEDDPLRLKLKDSLAKAFLDYTEAMQGRIGR